MSGINYVNTETDRKPVDWLAIDNDMPMELAVVFVGKTPAETARRIQMFNVWLAELIADIKANGYPLSPMGGVVKDLYPRWRGSGTLDMPAGEAVATRTDNQAAHQIQEVTP